MATDDDSPNPILAFLAFLVAAIAQFQPNAYTPEAMPQNVAIDNLASSYDFIVVGGGAAGFFLNINSTYMCIN